MEQKCYCQSADVTMEQLCKMDHCIFCHQVIGIEWHEWPFHVSECLANPNNMTMHFRTLQFRSMDELARERAREILNKEL